MARKLVVTRQMLSVSQSMDWIEKKNIKNTCSEDLRIFFLFFLTQKLKREKPPIYIQKWSRCGIRSSAWSVTDLNKKKSISVSDANWMTNTFAEVSHEAYKGEAFREMIQVHWWGQCMTMIPNQEIYDFIKAVTLFFRDFVVLDINISCSYKVYRMPEEISLIIIDL